MIFPKKKPAVGRDKGPAPHRATTCICETVSYVDKWNPNCDGWRRINNMRCKKHNG